MTVERFQMKHEHGWICARPDEKGDWVRHSDYAALEAECERLRNAHLPQATVDAILAGQRSMEAAFEYKTMLEAERKLRLDAEAKCERLRGERDRQYDETVSQIFEKAQLQAKCAEIADGWAQDDLQNPEVRLVAAYIRRAILRLV